MKQILPKVLKADFKKYVKKIECGHVCEKICHVYDCNEIKCLKPCVRIIKNCRMQKKHKCTKLCWQEYGKCEFIVDKKLPCDQYEELVNKKLSRKHIRVL